MIIKLINRMRNDCSVFTSKACLSINDSLDAVFSLVDESPFHGFLVSKRDGSDGNVHITLCHTEDGPPMDLFDEMTDLAVSICMLGDTVHAADTKWASHGGDRKELSFALSGSNMYMGDTVRVTFFISGPEMTTGGIQTKESVQEFLKVDVPTAVLRTRGHCTIAVGAITGTGHDKLFVGFNVHTPLTRRGSGSSMASAKATYRRPDMQLELNREEEYHEIKFNKEMEEVGFRNPACSGREIAMLCNGISSGPINQRVVDCSESMKGIFPRLEKSVCIETDELGTPLENDAASHVWSSRVADGYMRQMAAKGHKTYMAFLQTTLNKTIARIADQAGIPKSDNETVCSKVLAHVRAQMNVRDASPIESTYAELVTEIFMKSLNESVNFRSQYVFDRDVEPVSSVDAQGNSFTGMRMTGMGEQQQLTGFNSRAILHLKQKKGLLTGSRLDMDCEDSAALQYLCVLTMQHVASNVPKMEDYVCSLYKKRKNPAEVQVLAYIIKAVGVEMKTRMYGMGIIGAIGGQAGADTRSDAAKAKDGGTEPMNSRDIFNRIASKFGTKLTGHACLVDVRGGEKTKISSSAASILKNDMNQGDFDFKRTSYRAHIPPGSKPGLADGVAGAGLHKKQTPPTRVTFREGTGLVLECANADQMAKITTVDRAGNCKTVVMSYGQARNCQSAALAEKLQERITTLQPKGVKMSVSAVFQGGIPTGFYTMVTCIGKYKCITANDPQYSQNQGEEVNAVPIHACKNYTEPQTEMNPVNMYYAKLSMSPAEKNIVDGYASQSAAEMPTPDDIQILFPCPSIATLRGVSLAGPIVDLRTVTSESALQPNPEDIVVRLRLDCLDLEHPMSEQDFTNAMVTAATNLGGVKSIHRVDANAALLVCTGGAARR